MTDEVKTKPKKFDYFVRLKLFVFEIVSDDDFLKEFFKAGGEDYEGPFLRSGSVREQFLFDRCKHIGIPIIKSSRGGKYYKDISKSENIVLFDPSLLDLN